MKLKIFVLISLTSIAFAARSAKDVEQLLFQLKDSKKNFVESDIQLREAQAQIFKLQRQLLYNKRDQEKIKKEIQFLNTDVRQQLGLVKKLSFDVGEQKRLLQKRLKNIINFQSQNLAQYIFSSGSLAELDRNFKALLQLSRTDLYLLQNYASNKKRLVSNQNSLKKKLKSLSKAKENLKQKELQLTKMNEQQALIISSLSSTKQESFKN